MIGYVKSVVQIGSKSLLQIETDTDAAQSVCEAVQDGLCDIDIKLHKEFKKRSLDANSYLWVICGEIAKILNNGESNVDVYREAIRHVGVYQTSAIPSDIFKDVKESWELRGIGWQVIVIGEFNGATACMLCKGSSTYTTEEMSRLIDYVVGEAKELDIQVLSDRELSLLKEEWK